MHGDISIETIFPTGYILPGCFSASIRFVAYYYAIFWNAFYYQYDRLVGRDQNTFLPLQNLIILGQVVSIIFSTEKIDFLTMLMLT